MIFSAAVRRPLVQTPAIWSYKSLLFRGSYYSSTRLLLLFNRRTIPSTQNFSRPLSTTSSFGNNNQNWRRFEELLRQRGLPASFHYDNLQLQPGHAVTRKRLKQQFQKLAFHWHPDRNQEPEAKEQFRQIHESYRILADPVQRRDYDNWILYLASSPLQQQQSSAATAAADFSSSSSSSTVQFSRDPEKFYDYRAARFARQRQRFTTNNTGNSGSHGGTYNYSPSGGYYSASTFSAWTDQQAARIRQSEREEHERVNMRRSIMAESQFKFALIFTVMTAVIVLSVRRDEAKNRASK